MNQKPTPKKPQEKDDTYMHKAYMYTAVLLILGLVGGLFLADRIVKAEAHQQVENAEEYSDDDADSSEREHTPHRR